MKKVLYLFSLLPVYLAYGQVGVNTENVRHPLHVDAKSDNSANLAVIDSIERSLNSCFSNLFY